MRLQITDVDIVPVAFRDPPLLNSIGVHQPYALRTLLRLSTDAGFVGWGETYGGARMQAALQATRENVIGLDVFEWEVLRRAVPDPRSRAGIEVACLDALGQALERPVCDLLGGRYRDRVPFSAYLFFKLAGDDDWGEVRTPEALLGEARRFVSEFGFRTLKVKGGVLPPDEEIETVRLLHSAFGPDYRLRLDPNGAWSVPTSIRVGQALAHCLEYLEDPAHGMENMAAIAAAVPVPLATNACVVRFEHLAPAVRTNAVQVVLSDHHYWGGLWATKELATLCRHFGLGVSMHSNSHLGISLAAMTHVAAAVPNLDYACDTHYPWQREDVLLGGRLRFEEGCLAVPTGPGLGVQVDESQVVRLARQYRECGLTERDDRGEMRRYHPDWTGTLPRW